MGNSRKMIKKLSIIMIVVFAIGMLASAILFLKNTIASSVLSSSKYPLIIINKLTPIEITA